jgi:hypothetical protein
MKNLLFLFLLMPMLAFSQVQNCVKVDSIYSTAKLRELGNRDIRFGIKQMTEDMVSNKYCLSETGDDIDVEVFYFGIPKSTIRIVGVEKTTQVTQVGVRIYFKGQKFEGYGESETEVRAVMIELVEGKVPFSKMTVSNALKKAIEECVSKMP